MRIKITRGLNIPLAGAPEPFIEAINPVRSVALLGADYVGLKPGMLVQPGDRVQLGQALFVDKRDPAVMFTSPGSGTVAAVNRGARRVLQSIVIELGEENSDVSGYADLTGIDPAKLTLDAIGSALCTSGLWTAFRTRPYGRVPHSDTQPRSIFVTAMDTRPLAANPALVIAGHQEPFAWGLRILSRLTEGPVFMCTGPDWNGPTGDSEQIRHVEFTGPHPAGLAGTHIHHLDPVGPNRTVWHIGYQDVIAIGKLFSEGRLWVERTLALSGTGFIRPRLITARLGAGIHDIVDNEIERTDPATRPPRVISGSVLHGRTAAGTEAYLGRYHQQISAIPDNRERRLFGWLRGASVVAGLRKRRQTAVPPFSTARNGRPTAIVPVEAFERIMPLDILPTPLLRALLIRDTDQAQALGCLELDTEDLALCSFVCPAKIDYAEVLRINLDQIESEG